MKPAARLKLFALSGLVLATGFTSVLSLMALNSGGEARFGPLSLLHVAAGYDRRARALLDSPAAPAPAAVQVATRLSQQAIGQFPYDTSAWLQLAWLDAAQHGGRLSAQGAADLQRSYDLVAIDPDIGPARIRLALENWARLTFELRTAATTEAKAMATTHRAEFQTLHSNINDPVGRLTLGLWLSELDAARCK